MKRKHIFLVILFSALILLPVIAGAAFLLAHPKCQTCGRRYGPLIDHPYRHQTSKLGTGWRVAGDRG